MTAAVEPRIDASTERGSTPHASVTRTRWPWWAMLVCAALVVYVGTMLDGHWVADDEGLLGQSAERVLLGELPHRDFADTYTGGLSFLHAWVFRVLGVDLLHLRWVLLLFMAVWVPIVYACASRFLPAAGAVALTAMAVAWSVPNYPAAMPSWYNLFFATFGLLALFRHAERGRRRWLLVAGACGGVSIVIKIAGLYFVAASLLYLVARSARLRLPVADSSRGGRWVYGAVAFGGLACFAAALIGLVWPGMTPEHAFHFAVPGLMLAGVAGAAVLPATDARAAARARLLAT
ncbi:MAG: glycosyltransferase family 39 protein, partial [Gemmatimonadales bacterium]